MEGSFISKERIQEFVLEYINAVESDTIEVSNKRNSLKTKVKQLAAEYKIPKDFANFVSLFLLTTKFFYIEDKTWKVDYALKTKIQKTGFLLRNMFKFLFFSRDYNEYYKTPLVWNTAFSINDFEVINKRKSIISTLVLFENDASVSFDNIYKTLTLRYAFFREYNDPDKFYYAKGDVFSNKQFIFLFIFKTLYAMGIVEILAKGKSLSGYSFSLTEIGKELINAYLNKLSDSSEKEQSFADDTHEPKKVVTPYDIIINKGHSLPLTLVGNNNQSLDLNTFVSLRVTSDKEHSLLDELRSQLVRRVQEENIPNLLV